jgi:hypothetical protein
VVMPLTGYLSARLGQPALHWALQGRQLALAGRTSPFWSRAPQS